MDCPAVLFLLLLLPAALSSASPLPFDATTALRSTGYSLSAAVLSAASLTPSRRTGRHLLFHAWNATGTLFVPHDSALKNHPFLRRGSSYPPPASLFLYHTARSPPLTFSDLASLPSGSPIPTFSLRRRCLFLLRTPSGNPCLATSYRKAHCVKIRHPDLFFDRDLAIHGVDGVLDPSAASACYSASTWRHHSHLDRAVRALRRRGYVGVANEMERRRAELAEMPGVTVLAHRGQALPRRYDLRRHVAPRRYRLLDLSRLPRGAKIATMASNSTVSVGTSSDGAVTVDGVEVEASEVFRNGWAVVLSIQQMLPISDDVADQVSDGLDYADLPLLASSAFPSPLDPVVSEGEEATSVGQDLGGGDGSPSPRSTGGRDGGRCPDGAANIRSGGADERCGPVLLNRTDSSGSSPPPTVTSTSPSGVDAYMWWDP